MRRNVETSFNNVFSFWLRDVLTLIAMITVQTELSWCLSRLERLANTIIVRQTLTLCPLLGQNRGPTPFPPWGPYR